MIRNLVALVLIGCCFASPHAFARSVRSREVQVIIHAVDRKTRTLTLAYEGGHGPHSVVWNASTQFVRDSQFVLSNEVSEGMRATVYYRSSLFGKPFIVKMVWHTDKAN